MLSHFRVWETVCLVQHESHVPPRHMGIDGHFALQRGTQQEGGKPPEEIKLQLQRVDADGVSTKDKDQLQRNEIFRNCVCIAPLQRFSLGS